MLPPPSLSLSLSHASPSHPLHLPLFECYTIYAIPYCPSLPPFLPDITLVEETSPVDELSNSDHVTEGLQFAYTLPQHQEDNDTALVGVHQCVYVLYVLVYVHVHCMDLCGVYA